MKTHAIQLSKAFVDREVRAAACAAINSGRYILGASCAGFERRFSGYVNMSHGVLANSATSVMQLALLALGIGPDDEVIVPSLTAFPTIEPILHVGAVPVFADVDDTATLDPVRIAERITRRTRAIMPVHLYGNPANMAEIARLARTHRLTLLEDACQAHGAEYARKKCGSFGHAGFFSFYPSKNLTFLGDGGIMVTGDQELALRVRMLRDHGRKSKYLHDFAGFNMRANEIQAAIGLVQLGHLDEFNNRRRHIAARYRALLKDVPLVLPVEQPRGRHVYHMFVVRTPRRDDLARYLAAHGIETGVHYPVPCHKQPAMRNHPAARRWKSSRLPHTEACCREVLSLPMHPFLTGAQITSIAGWIRRFFASTQKIGR
jgi:dTDP-4-amino-4,6-dideoxygalactose transaminase